MCPDCSLVFRAFFGQKHGFCREISMGLPVKVMSLMRQSAVSKDAKSMF